MSWGVYGPADYLQVALSRLLQEIRRHQIAAHRDLPGANLYGFLERVLNLPVEKQSSHQRRLNPAEAGQNRGFEGDHHNPGNFAGIPQRADQDVFATPEASRFEFEVKDDIVFLGKFKNLLQRGNALPREIAGEPRARVELPDLRHGHVVDGAMTVGGSVDGFVMDSHKVGVSGQLQISLDKSHALCNGTAKSGESVFRGVTGSAPMGNGEHVAGFLREQSGGYKTGRTRDAMSYATTERPLRSPISGACCLKPNNEARVVERKARRIGIPRVILQGGALLCLATGAILAGAQTSRTRPISAEVKDSSPLAREVHHQLLALPFYSVFDNIGFSLEGSKVTLFGQVLRWSLKKNAEAEIESIEGIDVVVNRIEVLPASASDDELRRSIYRSIFEDSTLSRYAVEAVPSIHIIVRNGDVALEGTVSSAADKNLATARTNGLANVRSVKNNLIVQAKGGGGE